MKIELNKEWEHLLEEEIKKEYFGQLIEFVSKEYSSNECYPPQNQIFRAFDLCALNKIKVVVLGQDPYHGNNQANGLAFSVGNDLKLPPSLKNIFKELKDDMSIPIPKEGNLESWAKQGVLLLNATLTVRAHEAGSHQKMGWEKFTDRAIQLISESTKNVVFLLWGGYAQKKIKLIDESKHLIIKSPHPSPLSSYRGFFGSKPFSKINSYLEEKGKEKINWEIDTKDKTKGQIEINF